MFINQLTFDDIKKLIKSILPKFIKEEKHREIILKTMTIAIIDNYVEVNFKHKNVDHNFVLFDFEITSSLLQEKDDLFVAEYRKLMAMHFFKKNHKGETTNKYMDALIKHIKLKKQQKLKDKEKTPHISNF